jgi:acetate kinase
MKLEECMVMKILVLNCGSSTLKFQLIDVEETGRQRKLARGIVDRIGGNGNYRFIAGDSAPIEKDAPVRRHEEAVALVISWLQSTPQLSPPDAAGHRVVHGGRKFTESVAIDDAVLGELEALCDLAPLHNPAAVSGIRAARKILGSTTPMAAVFDTSFHHGMPEYASTYAIPQELSRKHGVRRYGFHGVAHEYDVARYAELNGKQVREIDAVVMHLGNGCSASAIRNGQSVDTSMGFTPLEGLVMGTRSGDLDPALVSYLARQENVDAAEVESWLNKRSGLLGVSGLSNDMRELTAVYNENSRARLAVDLFCYRARKYIGAYLAALGGAEAVIFSGGIGENSALVRRLICGGMEWLGLRLDVAANDEIIGREGRISTPDSQLAAYVIHTDEEAIIARETARIIRA